MTGVSCDDRDRQQNQGNDSDDDRGRYTVKRKEESRHTRQHCADQKQRAPSVEFLSDQ